MKDSIQRLRDEMRQLDRAVPTSWLDPLLARVDGPQGGHDLRDAEQWAAMMEHAVEHDRYEGENWSELMMQRAALLRALLASLTEAQEECIIGSNAIDFQRAETAEASLAETIMGRDKIALLYAKAEQQLAEDARQRAALIEQWRNEAEALKFYVGEQERRSALSHCAEELAALTPSSGTK